MKNLSYLFHDALNKSDVKALAAKVWGAEKEKLARITSAIGNVVLLTRWFTFDDSIIKTVDLWEEITQLLRIIADGANVKAKAREVAARIY